MISFMITITYLSLAARPVAGLAGSVICASSDGAAEVEVGTLTCVRVGADLPAATEYTHGPNPGVSVEPDDAIAGLPVDTLSITATHRHREGGKGMFKHQRERLQKRARVPGPAV